MDVIERPNSSAPAVGPAGTDRSVPPGSAGGSTVPSLNANADGDRRRGGRRFSDLLDDVTSADTSTTGTGWDGLLRLRSVLGTGAEPEPPKGTPSSERRDRLAPFHRLIVVGRVASLVVTAIAIAAVPNQRTAANAIMLGLFAALTATRCVRPIRETGHDLTTAMAIVAELALVLLAICLTGYWQSPLAFMILPAVLVGAFSQGSPLVLGYSLVPILIVSLVQVAASPQTYEEHWRRNWQWSIQIVAFSIGAALARRIVHDALLRQSDAIATMNNLTSANDLLFQLHRVAQSLPASLDLDDVLATTVTSARELFACDAVTVLSLDETIGHWEVLRADGLRLRPTFGVDDLPAMIVTASRAAGVVRLADHPVEETQTLLEQARSGLYVPLRSRHSTFGVLALEYRIPDADTQQRAELLRRFAGPASIAIDNARWFGRIRRVAADEERVRIARDLHDRIGQSLAFIGFELDRIAKQSNAVEVAPDITQLRGNLRTVVAEVRETLYDIRTDVRNGGGAEATISEFLERVRARNAALDVNFETQVSAALPPRQEREMWMIAQEAIVNVERHARATALLVRWFSNGSQAVLEVIDNGRGFSASSGRIDSYGLRGLQERAAAIGARLEIESRPDQGTVVRCRLD